MASAKTLEEGVVHILWMQGGLSCDGDSVSITAAEQPSIEDVLLGNIPGLPKVHLHNPVLAYEVGDESTNPQQVNAHLRIMENEIRLSGDCTLSQPDYRIKRVAALGGMITLTGATLRHRGGR